jgi:hypothetical protein
MAALMLSTYVRHHKKITSEHQDIMTVMTVSRIAILSHWEVSYYSSRGKRRAPIKFICLLQSFPRSWTLAQRRHQRNQLLRAFQFGNEWKRGVVGRKTRAVYFLDMYFFDVHFSDVNMHLFAMCSSRPTFSLAVSMWRLGA